MVRILTCHHFGGQKIGKCEEALHLAVANDYIVVALEHEVNVYAAEPHKELTGGKIGIHVPWNGTTKDGGEIGTSPIYFETAPAGFSGFKGNSPGSLMSPGVTRKDVTDALMNEGQIKLSHSFPTVDLIESVSFNRRGNYLLCLEKREQFVNSGSFGSGSGSEGSGNRKTSRNIRAYFNWDNENQSKPMRARIAGLVSPTGAEPDDDALAMVEIPVPQPPVSSPGSYAVNVVAVTSCSILGHVASLTDAGNVHLYTYKLKDGKGRGSRCPYADFDFAYTIEAPGMSNDSLSLSFVAGVVAVNNKHKAAVFRIVKQGRNRVRSLSNDSGGSSGTISSGGGRGHGRPVSARSPLLSMKSDDVFEKFPPAREPCDKVVYDPKNESVKVHINLISRANQRRKFPESSSGVLEEFQEEIGLMNKARLVHSKLPEAQVGIEDLLRLTVGAEAGASSETVSQVELYPVRIRDELGGISCVIGASSQAFVYHIPGKGEMPVCRVVTYPLTAPLVSFTFDSLFFHALTETGLETYTCRSLYYAAKEVEGFERYKNDCPFQYETPSLVGIRPFMGVRHMHANETTLCLLSSPLNSNAGTSPEENLWTIYALRLPTVEMLYEDISKAAMTAKLSNPDTYITLTSELHLILRSYINSNPSVEAQFLQRYRATCKSMGIEDSKRGSAMIDEAMGMSDAPDKYHKEIAGQELVDRGVTFLNMSGIDLKSMFDEENHLYVKDKKLHRGITRFINVRIEDYVEPGAHVLSPKLAGAITDYLVAHSPESLVRIVTNVPALRESNCAKILEILKKLADSQAYKTEVAVALLLALVTLGGCDKPTRVQVKEILSHCQSKTLETCFKLMWLLDLSEHGKPKITDLTVSLSAAGSSIPSQVIFDGIASNEINLNQVLVAFSQGISLNSDSEVQQSLSKTLTQVIENYFVDKLRRFEKHYDVEKKIIYATPQKSPGADIKGPRQNGIHTPSNDIELSEEEIQALKTLLRGYVAHITLKPSGYQGGRRSRPNSGGSNDRDKGNRARIGSFSNAANRSGLPRPASPAKDSEKSDHASCPLSCLATCKDDKEEKSKRASPEPHLNVIVNINTLSEAQLCLYGKVPNFLIHLIKDADHPLNSASSAYQVIVNLPGVSDETKEYFIKLSSLLASPLGSPPDLRDIVTNFLETKGQPGQALHTCLQVLSEPPDKVLVTLIAKFPLAIMYYAKEMFGRSSSRWKTLVMKLKEKIYSNPDDVDVFTTIIESVYLYLANTLTPTELEEVLDKGEENSKYFKACKRTEMANAYNNMVVQLSNEYLQ